MTSGTLAHNATSCRVCDLDIVNYEVAWQLQKRLVAARAKGEIPDLLLLLEHPPVITVGRSGSERSLLVSREQLEREGIPLFFTERGGDITCHAPGQLVAYPIIYLRERGDLHQYVWGLEEVMLRTLSELGLTASRRQGYPGVWLGDKKVGALGVRVSQWVACHGFSLNISNDLRYYSYIRPCGLPSDSVTSIYEATGSQLLVEQVKNLVTRHFSDVFGVEMEVGSPEWIARLSP
ncbi:MAG: lipoyl(octanoyl) transferase LipB [Chloroflexota bacterium]